MGHCNWLSERTLIIFKALIPDCKTVSLFIQSRGSIMALTTFWVRKFTVVGACALLLFLIFQEHVPCFATVKNISRHYQMPFEEQNCLWLKNTDLKELYPPKWEWLDNSSRFPQCFHELSISQMSCLHLICYNTHCELIHDFLTPFSCISFPKLPPHSLSPSSFYIRTSLRPYTSFRFYFLTTY